MVLSSATIFCVARPVGFHATQNIEFQLKPAFAIGTQLSGPDFGKLGGTTYSAPSPGSFAVAAAWTGQTVDDTPMNTVVMTWDGERIAVYMDGFFIGYTIAMAGPPGLTGPITVTDITSFNGQAEWTTWGVWGRKLEGSEIKRVFGSMADKYGLFLPL